MKTARAKNYTKAEVKILKDMTLSDQQVAEMVNRSRQAVYCKRWTMKLYGKKKRVPVTVNKQQESTVVSGDIIEKSVANTVERIVLGNVTVDLASKTLTVHF